MRPSATDDFEDKTPSLSGNSATAPIEQDGQQAGAADPLVAKDRAARLAALERLGATVETILAETGMSEGDLVAALTWDK